MAKYALLAASLTVARCRAERVRLFAGAAHGKLDIGEAVSPGRSRRPQNKELMELKPKPRETHYRRSSPCAYFWQRESLHGPGEMPFRPVSTTVANAEDLVRKVLEGDDQTCN
jgi:hypothetical protein